MTRISVTHITTATALVTIDDVVFITDPIFCPAGTEFPLMPGLTLKTPIDPALSLAQLPIIDAVLLSHEDHPDNLDDEGRKLLDARQVFTTPDGAKNLAPRPAVVGLKDWETTETTIKGKQWKITATPCTHLPGGECVGFILESESLGKASDVSRAASLSFSPFSFSLSLPFPCHQSSRTAIRLPCLGFLQGRPNAVWFTGDTIYLDSWKEKFFKWNILVALVNLGAAMPDPAVVLALGDPKLIPEDGVLQITMGGSDAVKLVQDLGIAKVVPMHFEGWGHFTQYGAELKKVVEKANIMDQVHFVEPGVATEVCTI
jgi:L-ascorbate metabolism protein UlaG (beta-lactamase superfamily)